MLLAPSIATREKKPATSTFIQEMGLVDLRDILEVILNAQDDGLATVSFSWQRARLIV